MVPSYLYGDLAPVTDEIDARDLPVEGVLPAELNGRYLRNGPNPRPGEDPGHWFAGHGMLHGVRLRDGRAEWYRNRWTRTTPFTDGAVPLAPDGRRDLAAVTANTSVIRHSGRTLALVENGLPYEVTPELDTVGACDFGGRLTTAMTAHPKRDPDTGELLFFGYGFAPPYLTYHRLSAGGELVESRHIEVPGPTMMHDFAITRNHVVWLDLPVIFDIEIVKARRGLPYRWDDGYGARLGVMGRADGRVRWFGVDPCYVFHVGNACEDASGRVVLDAVRYSPESFQRTWASMGGSVTGVPGPAEAGSPLPGAALHRWTLDLDGGVAKEEALDDRLVEFPTINEERTGLPSRHLYTVADDAIVKYDVLTGASAVRRTGGSTGEAVFVPAEGARAEDEGWLMSIVTAADASALLVLDAGTLEQVAAVRLPRRVPAGFHGDWFPDA